MARRSIRFSHRNLWNEETVRSHEGGWRGAMDSLERTLAANAPSIAALRGGRALATFAHGGGLIKLSRGEMIGP